MVSHKRTTAERPRVIADTVGSSSDPADRRVAGRVNANPQKGAAPRSWLAGGADCAAKRPGEYCRSASRVNISEESDLSPCINRHETIQRKRQSFRGLVNV